MLAARGAAGDCFEGGKVGYTTETTEAAAEDLRRTYYPALEREDRGDGTVGTRSGRVNVSRRSVSILRSAKKIIRKKDVTWFPRYLFWAII